MRKTHITIPAAAEEKGCSRQTIYTAIKDGRLVLGESTVIGLRPVIKLNKLWHDFAPAEVGGRMHKNNT